MTKIAGVQVSAQVAQAYKTGSAQDKANIVSFIKYQQGQKSAQGSGMGGGSAASMYGFQSLVLDDPQIKSIIKRAAKEGWTPDRVQAAIMKTRYWKTHSDSQRQWAQLKKSDPSTAKERLANAQESVSALAAYEGIDLGARLGAISEAVASGKVTSEAQIKRMILAEAQYNPTAAAGGLTAQASQIKARGDDYGVSMTGQGAFDWAKKMEGGTADAGVIDEYLKQQAVSRFGSNATIVSALDRGQTVRQALDPQLAQVSDLLEIDPDTIKLTDPKWSAILEQPDQQVGLRVMTSAEAARWARSQDAYKKTANGQATAASLAESISKAFGNVA